MAKREYIGEKFGRLTVLEEAEKQGSNRMFLCRCDCGKEKNCKGNTFNGQKNKKLWLYNEERFVRTKIWYAYGYKVNGRICTWRL